MNLCYDCQNYLNLKNKKTGGGLHIGKDEFLAWKAQHGRSCHYCHITSDGLYALKVTNPRNARFYESIGVDRIDNDRGYSIDNIVPCCGVCNGVRAKTFTVDEMRVLGPVIREQLESR